LTVGRIIILDESTANKIAAGEVIERPASVIKELVENSIDAGADNINVEIRNGGISFIRVTDNGSGIEEDDAQIAFDRHATSKIRRAEDLRTITSMGFRGEALASIAAVSEVQMITRVKSSVQGVSVKVKGGSILEVKPAGCPTGTSITVRELFFNTPARYKFLKKDSAEAAAVADTLNRIALAYPDISFKLTSNGTVLLHTPGNGDLKSTIFSVYGAETAKHLLEVDYQDENAKITGYIGKAEIARSNRNHQTICINRRIVRNKTVSSAIDSAYSTFLMKNRHAFVFLDIRINPVAVDVNVHPSKMEVKFSNDQDIFRSVYHAVNGTLLSRSSVRALSYTNTGNDVNTGASGRKRDFQQVFTQQDFEQIRYELKRKREEAISGTEDKVNRGYIDTQKNEDARENKDTWESKDTQENRDAHENNDVQTVSNTAERDTFSAVNEKAADYSFLKNARIIGQAFATYIFLESGEDLFLVDQHAAHERIRYEELKEAYARRAPLSQMLVSGITIELNSSEYQFAISEEAFFNSLGFSYEPFGLNAILLRSVPFAETDAGKLFLETLELVMSGRTGEKEIIADETLYSIACKSAVKANKKLSEIEIRALLDRLSSLENPYTCPHGRPVIFKLRRYDLEKLFKRIV